MTKVFSVLSTVAVVAILAAVTWAAPQATVTTSTPSATPSGAWFVSNYDTSRRRVTHRRRLSSIPEWCQCGGIGWTGGGYGDCDSCAPGLTCFVNSPCEESQPQFVLLVLTSPPDYWNCYPPGYPSEESS
ncbi:hypothetical protein C8R45DRAFT_929771 [Mycena sanguinolenta]|nr:hypothetical protein C8R45DRAFT_929771 [Mycena sanguinolenta]